MRPYGNYILFEHCNPIQLAKRKSDVLKGKLYFGKITHSNNCYIIKLSNIRQINGDIEIMTMTRE